VIELLVTLLLGAVATGPVLWTNYPTCDFRTAPLVTPCREVRGQWNGTVDGRVWPP